MPFERTVVLVVDDNRDTQELVAVFAREAGYDVVLANNGANGLVLIETSDVDVVIADIVMPEMGGVELANRIRALRPTIAIVLMTGYTEYVDAVINIGAIPLLKPFTSSVMTRAVEDSLDAVRGTR